MKTIEDFKIELEYLRYQNKYKRLNEEQNIRLKTYEQVKNLILFGVSQQRELLFAYEKFLNSELENTTINFKEDGIKRFLANYSG